jgi:hypothetical protein
VGDYDAAIALTSTSLRLEIAFRHDVAVLVEGYLTGHEQQAPRPIHAAALGVPELLLPVCRVHVLLLHHDSFRRNDKRGEPISPRAPV